MPTLRLRFSARKLIAIFVSVRFRGRPFAFGVGLRLPVLGGGR